MDRLLLVAACVILASWAMPAVAEEQTVNLLQKYEHWDAYATSEGGSKVCFVASQPQDSSPKNAPRGPIYFYVSLYSDGKVTLEVSVRMGESFAPGGKVTVTIGNKNFELLTEDESAFVETKVSEEKLVKAMKAGASMRVQARSTSGANTSDSYSLIGVTDALERIHKECSGQPT